MTSSQLELPQLKNKDLRYLSFRLLGLLCNSNKKTDRYNRFKANPLNPIHSNTVHLFLQVLLADPAP